MLQVVKRKDNKFIIGYKNHYNTLQTNLSTIHPRLDWQLNLLTALFLKHGAVNVDGEFLFDNEETAWNCYMDIAKKNIDGLQKLDQRIWEVEHIEKKLYRLKVYTTAVPKPRQAIDGIAQLCKLTREVMHEIYIRNNGIKIEPNIYVFLDRNDANKCSVDIEDRILANKTIKKLTKTV